MLEEHAGKAHKKRKSAGKGTDIPPTQINPSSPKSSIPLKRSKRLMGKSSKQPEVSKPTSPKEPLGSKAASSPT